MSYKMKQNDYDGSYTQHSSVSAHNGKRKENFANPENLTRPESFACCPDIKESDLDESDSYRVVNINLKECATKLWNNLFGNLSIESATFFDKGFGGIYPERFQSVCTVPGCNYNRGDRKMRRRSMMRSRSETSKYDYRRPRSRRHSTAAKAKKMKVALKYCVLEKIAQLKICDSFLIELQQVLSRYPYTDSCFYWELLRVIQAEVDEHKCKKGSIDGHKYKQKLKQLYMLSYAITRLILQLDYITGGNPMLHFRRSKSWSQTLNQYKEDFQDPTTGQLFVKPFPRGVGSFRDSFQDDVNSESGCSCLPLGFFSRAIGVTGSEGESNCLTLKVCSFPDEYTSFDLESLNYLIDNLNCSLQLECSKGSTGKCQVPNCPYPVPVRDEKVIKEIQSSIHAVEELVAYLERLSCYKEKASQKREARKADKLSGSGVRSKSILKNRANVRRDRGVEIAAYPVQCPPGPPLDFQSNSRCCSPVKEKSSRRNSIANGIDRSSRRNSISNGMDRGFARETSPNLRVTKVVPLKKSNIKKVIENKSFDLCFADSPKMRSTKFRRRSPDPESGRSRSGASCCSCSSEEDICEKCNKISSPSPRGRRRRETRRRDSCLDRECDFAFRVKPDKGKRKQKACYAAAESSRYCKEDKEDDVLSLCCNRECESKGNLITSFTKLAKKIDPNIPPAMCDPDDRLAQNYKTQKCIEKLRSCKSNVPINDCRHKKERIIQLVNLLSNVDCTFKSTNRRSASESSCKNDSCNDEVCDLYDQFLALACDEKCNKDKCDQACFDKLKCAIVSAKCCSKMPSDKCCSKCTDKCCLKSTADKCFAKSTTDKCCSRSNFGKCCSKSNLGKCCSKSNLGKCCSKSNFDKCCSKSNFEKCCPKPTTDKCCPKPTSDKCCPKPTSEKCCPKPTSEKCCQKSTSAFCLIIPKTSVGVQASSCSKELCAVNPCTKRSAGTSTGQCLSPKPSWVEPSKPTEKKICPPKLGENCSPCPESKRSNRCPTKDCLNLGASPSQVCRLVNSKSIECLRKKLESKYKALSKQQARMKKCSEKKKCKEEVRKKPCLKCRVRKPSKSKRCKPKRTRSCKSLDNLDCCKSQCSEGCKSKNSSKCSLKCPKSEKSVCGMKDCNNLLRGCKSKSCKMRCSRRIKSLSEMFNKKSCQDPCSLILGELDDKKKRCRRRTCSSSCRDKKSRSQVRGQNCEKLKECNSQLRMTQCKLKKSCSQLKRYDSKLKRCEAEIRRCQSQLNQCDEAKKRLEKCTKVLLNKLSQHEKDDDDCECD